MSHVGVLKVNDHGGACVVGPVDTLIAGRDECARFGWAREAFRVPRSARSPPYARMLCAFERKRAMSQELTVQ